MMKSIAFALTASYVFAQSGAPLSCAPEQIRLSLTGASDGSEMLVSWATESSSTPSSYQGIVLYGLTPTTMTLKSTVADTRNYTMCNLPSPSLHMALLSSLVPGATYFYTVTDEAKSCGASVTAQFAAPRIVGEEKDAYPFTIFTYGDMGISHSQDTVNVIAARINGGTGPDVITHAGDISYADNRGCPTYDTVQNTYYNEISPYASQVPVMFSSGNHEAFGSDSKGGFLAYRTRVSPTMPIANSSSTPFWYSFNAGRIHFLAFDIDQPWQVNSVQYDFIVNDLKTVNRALTPIIYAYSHFPMLCSNYFWCLDTNGKPTEAMAFRALYEPLFNAPETRVHIFVNGHVHSAEVAYPVATGSLVPSQTNWDNIKTTFNAMVGFPGDEEVCCNSWQKPAPAYSAWRTDDVGADGGTFGFGEFTFLSDTQAVRTS
jgi:hypothetical protein